MFEFEDVAKPSTVSWQRGGGHPVFFFSGVLRQCGVPGILLCATLRGGSRCSFALTRGASPEKIDFFMLGCPFGA